ncbi:MAG TPA: ABC transporter permease [Patescibacteria group bacterium]|nr:ABC transporter permease [Patescibacteria group bacterium]
MIRNYLKVAWRNLFKHKGYSFINIFGLSVGIACFIMISLWVRHELSYDRFHQKAERIYLVEDYEKYSDGEELRFSVNPPLLAPTLAKDYPEVEAAVRFRSLSDKVFRRKDSVFSEKGLAFCDPSFFQVFDFRFISGDPDLALRNPRSIILTRQMAEKYFGKENPLGQTLEVDNRLELTVSGVVEDVPSNSSLLYNFLVPLDLSKEFDSPLDSWGYYAYKTFILLKKNTDFRAVSGKIKTEIKRHEPEAIVELSLRPLTDIHFSLNRLSLPIFSLLAVLILLTACINYMNLATARAVNRAKEISLRKVVGATKIKITCQFYGESLFFSFMGLIGGLILAGILMPFFNHLSGMTLALSLLADGPMVYLLLVTTLVTGIIAGSYPAFYLSLFNPIGILRGSFKIGKNAATLRKILVTFQFIIGITLIVSTLIINRQLHFIKNRDLGFDKQGVLCLSLKGESKNKIDVLRNRILPISGIRHVAAVSAPPAGNLNSRIISDWQGSRPNQQILVYMLAADPDFSRTLNIRMAQGRFFSDRFSADQKEGIVVNEAAIKAMGMTAPLGKEMMEHRIIGVMKDFHFYSLHSRVQPLAVLYQKEELEYLMIKIGRADVSGLLSSLTKIWRQTVPHSPFEFTFYDDFIDRQYGQDRQIGEIINAFSMLTIIIACLGLLGLAAFSCRQRTKEIGIRKALGASLPKILFMLLKEFNKWILLANLVAWPLAYLVMSNLLRLYAFRISLNAWDFLLAGIAVLLAATATVSFEAVKAARANPVDSLRYE